MGYRSVLYNMAKCVNLSVFQFSVLYYRLDSVSDINKDPCIIFLVQVRLWAEVLGTPSSTRPGFELMISRS